MTGTQELMQVSIIINNYNYGEYLRHAIESALAQTWQAVQVIVVDDGSTDASREIIHEYQGSVIAILKPNAGQASAFNAGFAISRGDFVIFLDSDDVLLPTTVERVVAAFQETPQAAKVQYRMEIIDAAGVPSGKVKPEAHLPFSSGDLRAHVLSFPFDLTWMATSGNAFAAQVLRKIFPMPEADYRILADFYLAHLTALFGPVVALDQVGAYYRVHGKNSFALSNPRLDLEHIRQMITYANLTEGYIRQCAQTLGLENESPKPEDMLSVSTIAERMISVKLEPAQHPIRGDSVVQLFWLGVRAALGRFDVSLSFKMLFALWFLAIAVAPRAQTRWLAEKFFFPETRGEFNRVLGSMHHI